MNEEHELDWKQWARLSTAGAAAMVGRHARVVVKVKQVAPEAKITHYDQTAEKRR